MDVLNLDNLVFMLSIQLVSNYFYVFNLFCRKIAENGPSIKLYTDIAYSYNGIGIGYMLLREFEKVSFL